MNRKVFIFSDAHYGHPQSSFEELADRVIPYFEQADIIVCNGDLLDARFKHRAKELARSYADVLNKFSDKTFYFIKGNHDYEEQVDAALSYLKAQAPRNFHVVDDALKLGDAFITHGDLLARGQTAATRNKQGNGYLDWVAKSDPLGVLPMCLQQFVEYGDEETRNSEIERWGGKALWFTDEEGTRHCLTDKAWRSIKHIFTGHTHIGFINLENEGKLYHNTGSFDGREKVADFQDIQAIMMDFDGEKMDNIQYAVELPQMAQWKEKVEKALANRRNDRSFPA